MTLITTTGFFTAQTLEGSEVRVIVARKCSCRNSIRVISPSVGLNAEHGLTSRCVGRYSDIISALAGLSSNRGLQLLTSYLLPHCKCLPFNKLCPNRSTKRYDARSITREESTTIDSKHSMNRKSHGRHPVNDLLANQNNIYFDTPIHHRKSSKCLIFQNS